MNDNLIKVEVIGFSKAPSSDAFAVFLQSENHKKYLPIVIGVLEAQAISLILAPNPPPRPMTHDTYKHIIDSLRGEIEKVVITKLEENTFFAEIHLKSSEGNTFVIDARPSDSIAIALKHSAPIYVTEKLMNEAAISVSDESIDSNINSDGNITVKKLKEQLEIAIKNEDYELAAKLRDEIKKLEGKN